VAAWLLRLEFLHAPWALSAMVGAFIWLGRISILYGPYGL